MNDPRTKIETKCFVANTTIEQTGRSNYGAKWFVIYRISQTKSPSGTLKMSSSSYEDAFNATNVQYQTGFLLWSIDKLIELNNGHIRSGIIAIFFFIGFSIGISIFFIVKRIIKQRRTPVTI